MLIDNTEHNCQYEHEWHGKCDLKTKTFYPGKGGHLCILHASISEENKYIKIEKLTKLLDDWCRECEETDNENLPAFKHPGIKCWEPRFEVRNYPANLVFDDSEFTGGVSFNGATFEGEVSFDKVKFGNGKGQTTVLDKATFKENVTFRDAIFTNHVTFIESTFYKHVLFFNVIFYAGAYFRETTFIVSSSFHGSKFIEKGNASYVATIFGRDASFKNVLFETPANFIYVNFNGKAEFQDTTFAGLTKFFSVFSIGDMDFSGTTFSWQVVFKESIFAKKTVFGETSFVKKVSEFVKMQFHELEFKRHGDAKLLFNQCSCIENGKKQSGSLNFKNSECSKLSFLNTDLTAADFTGADISSTRFESCDWHKGDEPYAKMSIHDGIVNIGDEAQIELLSSTYRALKKNHEENHDFRLAGEFHFRQQEIRQKILKEKKEKTFGEWFDYQALSLYKRVADYGESWIRLGISLLVTTLTTSILVGANEAESRHWDELFSGILLGDWNERMNLLGRFIVYVVKSFVEIMLKIVPSVFKKDEYRWFTIKQDYSELFISFEIIVALILTALFVMAVRRRFRR